MNLSKFKVFYENQEVAYKKIIFNNNVINYHRINKTLY